MAIGENRYNQGTIGSQPNYPSAYNEGTIGKDPKYDDSYNSGKIGDKSPYPGDPPGGYGRVGGGLYGPGSQPMALHTEFIDDFGGDYKAYGNQDVVFYISRADNDSPGDYDEPPFYGGGYGGGGGSTIGLGYNGISVEIPIDAGGYSGPSGRSGMQSGANQIAMGDVARGLGEIPGGPMAPMSGFAYEEEEPLGRWSQNAAFQVNVSTAVRNALRTVPGLGSEVTIRGLASSEQMFNRMLLNGFVPNNELHQKRTADQILETLDRPSTSELAFQLAESTNGLLRYKDVVQKVNEGTVGAVTSKSRAIQERMSTTGKVSKV